MKRSINEISGMVLKAGRGAGLPLGHCEDLSRAAGYLAMTDPVALAILPDALGGGFDAVGISITGDVADISGNRSVMIAPLVVDAFRMGVTQVKLHTVDHPQIIFALCAANQIGVTHVFDGAELTLTRAGETPATALPTPATIAQSVWDRLDAFAQKTYVPATEASRLAGAGAGLTDND